MKRSAFSLIMLASAFAAQAQDPIIQTNYTADPSPIVLMIRFFFILRMMKTMQLDLKC